MTLTPHRNCIHLQSLSPGTILGVCVPKAGRFNSALCSAHSHELWHVSHIANTFDCMGSMESSNRLSAAATIMEILHVPFAQKYLLHITATLVAALVGDCSL